ncbi:MAG TPA: hypothetical protein VF030_00950, partial [Solirubrobacterales bacterium]
MPASLGVLLKSVDRGSGRQQLYEDQVPELLRRLARQTKVESITASNAIEGVEVDPNRAERLVSADPPRFRNRSEREFAGYADALDVLVRDESLEPLTVPRLLEFHRRMLAQPPWQETEGLLSGLC